VAFDLIYQSRSASLISINSIGVNRSEDAALPSASQNAVMSWGRRLA
jgi:hypothetical protein